MQISLLNRISNNNAKSPTIISLLVWSHTRIKNQMVGKCGLLVITLAFILLAGIPIPVDARGTCLIPIDRQISDIEISELYLGFGDGRSCEDKRVICWRVFGECLDDSIGNGQIDKGFWEVERRRVCDTRVIEMCLEGLEGEGDSKQDIARLSPRTDENAIRASLDQLPTQSSKHYPIITLMPLAPRHNKVQTDSSVLPFTWLVSTTTLTTVLAAPSDSDPIPTTIAITLFDENGDSVIDSEDLKITLQQEQDDNDDDDDDDDGTKDRNKSEQTIADVRKEFETYCAAVSGRGGPESCSWTGPQFVEHYTGNWTEFCSKSARKAIKEAGVNPPSRKKCKKCDPDKGIDERDSACLRLVFFTWPIEFGGVETLPTPTRGLSFPQRTLANSGVALGDSLQAGGIVFIVAVCALVGGFLGVF